ncbi:SURF1 family protein [Methylocapsa polymorpha]|uniref:SURF1-like protein n=1 Tax=Methylocapsa polymorpha TaxID=3080828 RepID=A0ABZ0HNP2_9HYPH|nr:SURF1 family protein [Methylocapsa sp. RX1]
MRSRLARLFWPFVFACAVGAVLAGLGVWQMQRLAWKAGLIAQIEARAKAPPEPLPAMAEWPKLRPEAYEYRHVEFDGRFENDKEALIFRASGGGRREPGYLVLTPLRLSSGGYVIVNRGYAPADRKEPGARMAGEIEGETHVSGLMRQPEPRNSFTPADDPAAGLYFTRDPALIAAHFGLAEAAPFSVDADDAPVPGGWPKGGATELAFPNNHLSYALTWFGLALGLFGVFGAYAWRELKSSSS